MTGHMGDEQLDREIRTFLAWQAEELAGAPTATDMALRIGTRVGAGRFGARRMPRVAWVVVAGMLILALVTVALIGALTRRAVDPPLSTGYEAVFIRHEGVEGGRGDKVVFAVDARGQRRDITRLRAIPFGVSIPTLGAVSPSGLLLVPSQDATPPTTEPPPALPPVADLHYEIIDLHEPTAAPIVVAGIRQDSEQLQSTPYYDVGMRPSIFWGPNDQVAIPWYERAPGGNVYHVAFVDGRTGVGSSVYLPDDATLLPHWSADGSGAMLTGNGISVLRRDGTIGDPASGIAPSTYSRHLRADGTVLRPEIVVARDGGEIVDAGWTATGDGIWLVRRSGTDGRVLTVERRGPGSESETVATVADAPRPDGSRLDGQIVGLAPDDSMLVLGLDRVTGTPENGSTEPVNAVRLLAPDRHDSFEIEGTFVGWMEVEP